MAPCSFWKRGLQYTTPDNTLELHLDEGWHLHQPAYCGKVVSTKVGCGRFSGKFSRAVPALIVKGGLNDTTNSDL
jgi:hypothetical protein